MKCKLVTKLCSVRVVVGRISYPSSGPNAAGQRWYASGAGQVAKSLTGGTHQGGAAAAVWRGQHGHCTWPHRLRWPTGAGLTAAVAVRQRRSATPEFSSGRLSSVSEPGGRTVTLQHSGSGLTG